MAMYGHIWPDISVFRIQISKALRIPIHIHTHTYLYVCMCVWWEVFFALGDWSLPSPSLYTILISFDPIVRVTIASLPCTPA